MPRTEREQPLTGRVDDPRGPCLTWPGRTWRVGGLRDVSAAVPSIEVRERFGGAPVNRLVFGDALDVARALLDDGWRGGVDLVYVDPPFASQASYTHEARLDGPADGRVTRTRAYDDSWPATHARGKRAGGDARAGDDGIGAYLDMLAPRLEAMAALLKPTGSLWVHLDWRAAYLVRVLLDEVFGRKRFLNEIVWRRAPNLGRQATSGQFGRTLDTLVVYGGRDASLHPPRRLEPVEPSAIRRDAEGRPFITAPRGDYTDASMARLAAEGRVHTTPSGRSYIKYFLVPDASGALCRERRIDTLWNDVPALRHAPVSERTGYPTQKPRALLERIVRCASPEGGTVVDLFAGSGTTGEVAQALGRRFVMADRSSVAINSARARLMRAGATFDVAYCGGLDAPEAAAPEVVAQRAGGGATSVQLVRPAEPLAWAVGARLAPGDPFVASWQSARKPGAVPVPASLDAVISGGTPAVEVRVYGDDGSVATVSKVVDAERRA